VNPNNLDRAPSGGQHDNNFAELGSVHTDGIFRKVPDPQYQDQFKKVRGILNKLTPEKFDKLINDILNIGLDSSTVLKGVIVLIFEKALDEPKYSSMYAQMCKVLVEKAPNFDPPDSNACTFKRLLLNKCRVEFENRVQIAQQYEKYASVVEEDAKYMAKRKMLGNIKFMGELGKMEIVHDTILHRCCEQLLVGRKKQPLSDQAEDLECLCHLIRTCGKNLDSTVGKVRMDQYFDRLTKVTLNENMSVRIRFMVQDLIDMRRNKWQARRIGKGPDGPRTIQQVREDAARDGCIYMPQENSNDHNNLQKVHNPMTLINPLEGNFFDNRPGDKAGNARNGAGPGGRRSKDPMEDIFGVNGGYGSPYLGTGPGTINGLDNDYDTSNSSNSSRSQNNDKDRRGSSGSRQSPTVSGHNMNNDSDRDRNNRGPGGREHGQNKPYLQQRSPQPRGGGQSSQGQHDAGNRDRMNQTRNQNLPDFGDRYSANRTKDRLRREQQNKGQDGQKSENPRDRNPGGPRGGPGGSMNNQGPSRSDRPWNTDSDNRQNNLRGSDRGGDPRNFSNNSNSDRPGSDNSAPNNLPPRFKKMILSQDGRLDSNDNGGHEVSLKPKTSSMIFKPKTPSSLPNSAKPLTNNQNILDPVPSLLPSGPALPPASGKVMQAPIFIEKKHNKTSQNSVSKKGTTREEVFAKVETILDALLSKESTNEALEQWKDASFPNAMTQTAVNHLYKVMLEKAKDKSNLDLVLAFVAQLAKDGVVNNVHCNEAFMKMLNSNSNNNFEDLAVVAASAIAEKIADFNEMAEQTKGSTFPVYFLALKKLLTDWSRERLQEAFDESDVKLLDLLPEPEKNESVLVKVLAEHELSFLMPLLSLKDDMESQLVSADATAFAAWIGDNVEAKYHGNPDFIMALFQVVFKHIVDKAKETSASETEDSNKAGRAVEAEKELLDKFRHVLKPFIADKPKLQLAAVYALQMSCNALFFPKGLLLRSFVNFYEMDIVDEHAFLQWKEDVNETYPGKGKALFQVNSWLTWLEEAESEEEEDEDEED
jgi:translation initiation factor 4G